MYSQLRILFAILHLEIQCLSQALLCWFCTGIEGTCFPIQCSSELLLNHRMIALWKRYR